MKEKTLEHLVREFNDFEITTYFFEKNINEDSYIWGKIVVNNTPKMKIFYELKEKHRLKEGFTRFVPLKEERWFFDNLLNIKEKKEKAQELAAVFKGEQL